MINILIQENYIKKKKYINMIENIKKSKHINVYNFNNKNDIKVLTEKHKLENIITVCHNNLDIKISYTNIISALKNVLKLMPNMKKKMDILKNICLNIPIILFSCGPSSDINLKKMKQIEENYQITKGKKNARSQEIQRLIARSLRGAANLKAMPGISVYVDCDVINADGGTRTASINGGYIALAIAFKNKYPELYSKGVLQPVGAISVGKVDGKIIDDLNYIQDSSAEVDLNIVMNSNLNLIEIQGTGENGTFSQEELVEMVKLGESCIKNIFIEQNKILTSIVVL